MIIALIISLSVLLTLLALNFTRSEKALYRTIKHLYGVEDPQFKNSLGSLLRPPLLEGNKIIPLINGKEIFPAMLADIQQAKHSICLETYIYLSGKIGEEFTEALAKQAQKGIAVHLTIDWFGSYLIKKNLNRLKNAGVHVQIFHPPRWYTIARLNNRTHRKLLIIDGTIGYLGGVGIADKWKGDAKNPEEWRDTHFRIEGPVVGHLQSSFVDNWIKTSSVVLHGNRYFPELSFSGHTAAQGFSSSAAGGSDSAHLMFLYAIACATKTITICSGYFVPDRLAINELISARRRGVEIKILLPGFHNDAKPVKSASRACWGVLLKSGIQIYEYLPTMMHVKLLVIDQFFCSVGSMNFDYRSFHLNYETNLNFFDYDIARKLDEQFKLDLAKSQETSFDDWQRRSYLQKLSDNVWSLLRTQF